jgi:hypothetical protein
MLRQGGSVPLHPLLISLNILLEKEESDEITDCRYGPRPG